MGVLTALVLVRRGHDRKMMVALGVGLGPLMLLVASDTVRRREGEARPLVIEPGADHGGGLDVLVLVQGRPDDVRSVLPSVAALRSELRTLTLARAVAYEWLEEDLDNEVVMAASSALLAARDMLPIGGAELALHPGTPKAVADRFDAQHGRTLVLFAIEESTTGSTSRNHG